MGPGNGSFFKIKDGFYVTTPFTQIYVNGCLSIVDECYARVLFKVTMRTESEEREVVEGGEPVLPTPEEARKPDPCTEVGLGTSLRQFNDCDCDDDADEACKRDHSSCLESLYKESI